MTDRNRIKNLCEAALMSADEPLDIEQLLGLWTDEPNPPQRQLFSGKKGTHRSRFSRIDDHAAGVGAERPDVVVAQGRKRNNLHPEILRLVAHVDVGFC